MSSARTRLLKIVRLRPEGCLLSGTLGGVLPIAGISPASIRASGLLSNMAIQHHHEEIEARIEQGVGKTTRHTLWCTGRMYDEQDTVEGAPEVWGGEYFTRHRRVQEYHLSLFP